MKKTYKTELFRKFLKHIGCYYVETKRHEKWNRDDLIRPIIFRASEKEIPISHIHTNLITLGMTHKEFEEIIKMFK